MSKRWCGMAVSGSGIVCVDLSPVGDGTFEVLNDFTFTLPTGDRGDGYRVAFEQIRDYLREHEVTQVVIKGSAVNRGGMKKAHLESAELRGVVIAAANSACDSVKVVAKASVSRRKGSRKVDEYLTDDVFWDDKLTGTMRKGSREAALLAIKELG